MVGSWKTWTSNDTATWSGSCQWFDASTNTVDYKIFTASDLLDDCTLRQQGYVAAGSLLKLPDGAHLIVDDLGNYRIEDKDAQVTYKANRVREFSPHLNASDMVAQFVDYVRSLGIRQQEVLGLPLELFINWLIIEAAERDHDPIPEGVLRIEDHSIIETVKHPRCLSCQRYIPKLHQRHRFPFCDPEHAARHMKKLTAC